MVALQSVAVGQMTVNDIAVRAKSRLRDTITQT